MSTDNFTIGVDLGGTKSAYRRIYAFEESFSKRFNCDWFLFVTVPKPW